MWSGVIDRVVRSDCMWSGVIDRVVPINNGYVLSHLLFTIVDVGRRRCVKGIAVC